MEQIEILARAVIVGLLSGLGHVSANVRMARGTWF
jgi:hypothetical protein